ncbi:MAG: type II toxin-antitoxin system RelB/DinJ family antitoxin [Cellvibrionaceae bacterium]|nr:type II toxin-antitoxin system RelB/DinJ family antitoxin [Cellvibrionaceae bacterium]
MTSNETVQARVTAELKADAEAIFSAMGLKTSDAIRLFLQQSVNMGGLPFQPKVKTPNTETIKAINEVARKQGTKYANTDDLLKDLGS